jgi:glycerophosphoryl diester phosphodiesterase
MIDRCHENGIICNFCQANKAELAKELFDMGIDCVLTDDYHRVKAGLEKLGR